jgi:hemoglobin
LSLCGCATGDSAKEKDDGFFTSGSPEADRRAENAVPNVKSSEGKVASTGDAQAEEKPRTLYQRLGEEQGIKRIVDDFIQRALEDPRVNWTRQGVVRKSWFRSQKVEPWQATPENLNRLKLHFVQFISLAAGGPTKYDGKPLKPAHLEMQITRAEFDATIGDLKASLDTLQIAPDVQKDLLSIFESTRQQIVVER